MTNGEKFQHGMEADLLCLYVTQFLFVEYGFPPVMLVPLRGPTADIFDCLNIHTYFLISSYKHQIKTDIEKPGE